MKFDLLKYADQFNQFNQLNTSLTESSVTVPGRPAFTKIYNIIRGKLLQNIVAINPVSQPVAAVFGKTRTIDSKNALAFSQEEETAEFQMDHQYSIDDTFMFRQGLYIVKRPFTIVNAPVQSMIEQLTDLLDDGTIEPAIVETGFGVSKLMITPSPVMTAVRVSQELLQDVEHTYGSSLVTDALTDSVAERINRSVVRFLEKTAVQTEEFTAFDIHPEYESARVLADRIIREAAEIQKDTGNVATYALVTPDVEAFLRQSGLIDSDGFLGELEIVSTRFYHSQLLNYVIIGFVRDADDIGDDVDTVGEKPFEYGSCILCPYQSAFVDIKDVHDFSENLMVQARYSVSVAPYENTKESKAGDIASLHAGKNLNARRIDVTIREHK